MKIRTLILIGITLSLIALWAIAYCNEGGDLNAVLMYLTVYGIVAIGIGIINGFFLKFAEKQTKKLILLIMLALLPILIFLGFLLCGIFRISFVGKFGIIGIGITNVIWIAERILTENKNIVFKNILK